MSITRDHESGEIRINGRSAKLLGLLEWSARLLVVPIMLYLVAHEIRHALLDDFVDKGPRLTPKMMEQALNRHDLEVLKEVAEKYPPAKLVAKVDDNAKALADLKAQVGAMDARLSTKIDHLDRAIRRLLGD